MSKIIDKIYDACYDINTKVSELSHDEAHFWARVSKKRFALTAEKILEYVDTGKKIEILNASGLGSGDHDVSIVKALKDSGIDFEWDVYDSPENPYLERPALEKYVSDLGINLIFFDYLKIENIDDKKYDVIIFTEIAEHIDHSVLLNALNYLNDKLEDDGKLIVTSPNALWLLSRVKILFGKEGNEYYGEGNQNLDKKVYGHIVYYTPQRLQRLVEDCGFKTVELFTFNWLPIGDFLGVADRMLTVLADFFTLFGRLSKGTIFLSVAKDPDNKNKLPFAV